MAFQETSWLDYIPGARQAYNFLVSKAAEFYLIGTQKIPSWERITAALTPAIERSGDTSLKSKLTSVTTKTIDLKGAWTSLETRVTQMLNQLRSIGLGEGEGLGVPVLVPVALAVALVALVGALYLFFGQASRNEAAVRDLVQEAAAKGVITTEQAARLLREPSGFAAGVGRLGTGLIVLGLAAAAIWFLPRRRSA